MRLGNKGNGVITTLVALSLASAACSKKSSSDASDATTTPGANESTPPAANTPKTARNVDEAIVTASTASLKMPGALSLLASEDSMGLRLAEIGGDYAADESHFYTDDKSMESLQTVQMILCFLAATGYSDSHVVNAGKYIAQVDMARCDKGKGGGGGGGSGGGQPEVKQVKLTQVIVDSVREENKPLIAKAWFDMKKDGEGKGEGEGGMAERIKIALAVAEGPSSSNPVGIFRMTFVQSGVKNDGTEIPTGHGQLESSRDENDAVVLTFIESNEMSEGQDSRSSATQVAVRLNVSASKVIGGWANLKDVGSEKHNGQEYNKNAQFKLAFDNALFAAHDETNSTDACRDQKDFNMNVYRYGVYNASTGNHIEMKGGFPFSYTKEAGQGRGFASYYGIWADGGSIADGTVITKESFGGAAAEQYTVKVGKGKLTRHTRHAITLDAMDGIDMSAWDMENNVSVRVVYNKTLGKFQKNGHRAQNEQTWTDDAASDYTIAQFNSSLWSDSMGGRVDIALDPVSQLPVGGAFYQDEDVTDTVGNIDLHCLQGCVKPGFLASEMQSGAMYMLPEGANADSAQWASFDYEHAPVYSFDGSAYVLKFSGNAVVMAAGQSLSQGQWLPNVDLIDTATFNAMRDGGKLTWQARDQAVTYSWSIGDVNNSWTLHTAILDSNNHPVSFDPPVNITYTHSAANEASGATDLRAFGKTFHIQYDGSNLQIPGHQDQDSGFWFSDFSIKGGVKSDDLALVFKPLEGNKYMKSVDAAKCTAAGLSIASVPALPALDSYDDAKANHSDMPSLAGLATLIMDGVYQGE